MIITYGVVHWYFYIICIGLIRIHTSPTCPARYLTSTNASDPAVISRMRKFTRCQHPIFGESNCELYPSFVRLGSAKRWYRWRKSKDYHLLSRSFMQIMYEHNRRSTFRVITCPIGSITSARNSLHLVMTTASLPCRLMSYCTTVHTRNISTYPMHGPRVIVTVISEITVT